VSSKTRAIIIDDEALSRRGLEIRLQASEDVEVVAQCANGREALAAIEEHRPDLLFLDVQMPGMSGFEVLAQLQQDALPMVIFVTAFDQYAIRAFEARALDYLLKPVEDSRLEAALDRARAQLQARNAEHQRDRLFGLIAEITGSGELALEELLLRGREALAPKFPDILPIQQGRDVVRVPVASIDWIDAAGDYMCIHAAGATHVLRGTMKELERFLDGRLFQRVHRSTIVNLQRVKALRAHMNGEYFLALENGQELKLSRSYRDKVEYFLKGNAGSAL
jgi:two-component system LytT family response regulator